MSTVAFIFLVQDNYLDVDRASCLSQEIWIVFVAIIPLVKLVDDAQTVIAACTLCNFPSH